MITLTHTRTPRRVRRAALWGVEATRAALDHAAAAITASTARGEGVDGKPLGVHATGPRTGQPITLRETGAMMRSLTASKLSRAGGQLAYRVAHARYVLRRRPGAIGLPADMAAAVRAIFRRAVEERAR